MNVIISPNIKKESVRIDPAGNVVNPRTKQIIKPVEAEYVAPTAQPTPAPTLDTIIENHKPNSMSEKINKMVEAKIAEKIDAIVEQRVADALKNL